MEAKPGSNRIRYSILDLQNEYTNGKPTIEIDGKEVDIENKSPQIINGASGDMGVNERDPIFYFHHCNIDRLFWIWRKKKYNQRDPDPEKKSLELIEYYPELIHLIVKDQLQYFARIFEKSDFTSVRSKTKSNLNSHNLFLENNNCFPNKVIMDILVGFVFRSPSGVIVNRIGYLF